MFNPLRWSDSILSDRYLGRLSQSPSHDLDISSGSRTPFGARFIRFIHGVFALFNFYRAYISCQEY